MKIFNFNKFLLYYFSVLLLTIGSSATAKDFYSVGACRASIDGLYTIYGNSTLDKLSQRAARTAADNRDLSKKLSPIYIYCTENYAEVNPGAKSTGSSKSDGELIFSSCTKKMTTDEKNYLVGYFVGVNYIYKQIEKGTDFDFMWINSMCFTGRD